jgi:glycosyltransferase involved in cell wall biosynthesis
MPFPPIDGGAQVMHYATLGLLANGIIIKTLALNPSRSYFSLNTIPSSYKEATKFESVDIDTKIKLPGLLINIFKKESYFIERFISKTFAKKIETILKKEKFDIIQLEHLYLCKYIDTIRTFSEAKIVLRPQNIEYIIWEQYIRNLKNPFKVFFLKIAIARLKSFEQSVNEKLDGIMPLTKDDTEIFTSFSDNPPKVVIPMGYDYAKLKNYNFQKQYENKPAVYHLASMDWLPNVEAVKWFLEKVMPVLLEQNYPVEIFLAGRKMPAWVYKYQSSNMKIIGEVSDPITFQEDKPIMIVPLLSGSGIRAKIIEGLALGKTIISTSVGAKGIAYENNINIIIADTPDEFAKQIMLCVSRPEMCKKIGTNARILSESNYHLNNTAKKMIEFYRKLLIHE